MMRELPVTGEQGGHRGETPVTGEQVHLELRLLRHMNR